MFKKTILDNRSSPSRLPSRGLFGVKAYLQLTLWMIVSSSISLNPVFASDAQSRFTIYGSGAKTCKIVLASAEGINARIAAWIAGYITAQNERIRGPIDVVGDANLELVFRRILEFCSTHPDAKIVDAAGVVIVQKMDEAQARLEQQFRQMQPTRQRGTRR